MLHISDAHITENKRWDVNSETVEKILNRIAEHKLNSGGIDLIAFTGDIVTGSDNALGAQNKYKIAGKVLESIALKLWGVKKKMNGKVVSFLPVDWKRRIIITTGNHDYAAMNDVVVQTKSRVIRSASPSKHQGGTMSKFTYLIEFMQYFLDAPIDVLIENDLNEVRHYRHLNLKMLILNSTSLVNSLQNNKVGFNKKKVENLMNLPLWDVGENEKCICLAHHSPDYKIDYIVDIYEPYKLFSLKVDCNVLELYKCFCEVVKAENIDLNSKNANDFKKLFDRFSEMISNYQKKCIIDNNLKRAVLKKDEDVDDVCKKCTDPKNCEHCQSCKEEGLNVRINDWIKVFYESDLYIDMQGLYNCIEYTKSNGMEPKDEFSLQLISKFDNVRKANENDRATFNAVFENALRNVFFKNGIKKRTGLVLAGHEHVSRETVINISTEEFKVYVEGMLEKKVSVITIDSLGNITRETC